MSKLIEVFKNMSRNLTMTISSILLIMLTMVMLGVLTIAFGSTYKTSSGLKESMSVVVYVNHDATQKEEDKLESDIKNLSDVGEISFANKDSQLEDVLKTVSPSEKDRASFQKEFSGKNNPLSDVFFVTPKNDKVDITQLTEQISKLENVESSDYGSEQGADKLIKILNTIQIVSAIMVVILVIISLFLIMTTLKLALNARKKEIEIMRLVGATKGYIVKPFAIEGILFGLIGGLLAFILTQTSYTLMYMSSGMSFFRGYIVEPGNIIIILLILQIGFAMILGFFSSIIAIRRYLKA